MRIVLMSDSHGLHDRITVPSGDLLIHAGDCTNDIGQASLRDFLRWFEKHPHPRKVFVAGNHDGAFEKWPDLARAMVAEVAPSVTYLQDSGVEIEGLRLWGSPYTPTFFDWFHMRDRGPAIKRHWDMIPVDIDILVTHGPAYGFNDWSDFGNEHGGCRDLLDAIKRVRPRVAVHGHFHGGYGRTQLVHDDGFETTMLNVSCCNEAYVPVNAPVIIEL